MARIYAQKFPVLSSCTGGSLLVGASFTASMPCNGYAYLMGFIRTDQALGASGVLVQQSIDYGQNWDYVSASDTLGANASAACKVEIIGNAVQIKISACGTEASAFRHLWQLRPI